MALLWTKPLHSRCMPLGCYDRKRSGPHVMFSRIAYQYTAGKLGTNSSIRDCEGQCGLNINLLIDFKELGLWKG